MLDLGIRSILVASDLGERSDAAVAAAGLLARANGADVHLVHSLDVLAIDPALERTLQEDIAHAERALEEQADRLLPRRVQLSSRSVSLSVAHAGVLERARDVDADLIVLGPQNGSTLDRVLGGTADAVLRRSRTPCLVVNTPLSLPFRRVVAAYDFSPAAERAVAKAIGWTTVLGHAAHPQPAELTCVHVIRPPESLGEYFDAIDDFAEVLDLRISDIRRQVLGATPLAANHLVTRGVVLWSDPVDDTIARYSAGSDLLVLGSTGTGPIQRLLLGSVAASLARRASCPVLIVPEIPRRKRRSHQAGQSRAAGDPPECAAPA